MFEKLFIYPAVIRRHRKGPLAAERAAYLNRLADQGMALGTILRQFSYCLCIAIALQRWQPDRCFDEDEVELLADEWAAQRAAAGRASSPRWPKAHFRFAATNFLQHLGRLRPSPAVTRLGTPSVACLPRPVVRTLHRYETTQSSYCYPCTAGAQARSADFVSTT